MFRFSCAVAVGIALSTAVPVTAQTLRPERPYRGLFAGSAGDTEQSLTLNGSLGGGWDDNLAADATGRPQQQVSDLTRTRRGSVGQGQAMLMYSVSKDRLTVSASAGTSARYYPGLENEILRRDMGRASVSMKLIGDLSANAFAAYAPYQLTSVLGPQFGSDPAMDQGGFDNSLDFPSSLENYFAYGGGLGYSKRLTQRTTLSADYQYRTRNSFGNRNGFSNQNVGATLSHNLTQGLGLRAGYRYFGTRYNTADRRAKNHLIDAGVDYSKALSFSRRTTLSFSTGSLATSREGERVRFQFIGGANLNREIGRTWSAALDVSRRVLFNEAWSEPLVSGGATVSLTGLITRRLSFRASAQGGRGRVGLAAEGGGFRGYFSSTQLSYALSRYVNCSMTYSYYRHRFGQAELPPGFVPDLDRHSVRAAVNVWAPLFQRARTPDATR